MVTAGTVNRPRTTDATTIADICSWSIRSLPTLMLAALVAKKKKVDDVLRGTTPQIGQLDGR